MLLNDWGQGINDGLSASEEPQSFYTDQENAKRTKLHEKVLSKSRREEVRADEKNEQQARAEDFDEMEIENLRTKAGRSKGREKKKHRFEKLRITQLKGKAKRKKQKSHDEAKLAQNPKHKISKQKIKKSKDKGNFSKRRKERIDKGRTELARQGEEETDCIERLAEMGRMAVARAAYIIKQVRKIFLPSHNTLPGQRRSQQP